MEEIKFKKLYNDTQLPTQTHVGDAGWDLYSYVSIDIPPQTCAKIETGFAMNIPNNTFAGIYARSGLATKQGLRPANAVGVVDETYTGPVIVVLYNDSNEVRHIAKGDRIAQMVIQPYIPCIAKEVSELTITERGEAGFGSSGMK